jgi:hypothetical protein
VAHVLLLHSVRGLRDLERQAQERLRAEGHEVLTPDLSDGEVPATLEDWVALEEKLWPEPLIGRAQAAADHLPAEAVLAGFLEGRGTRRADLGRSSGGGGPSAFPRRRNADRPGSAGHIGAGASSRARPAGSRALGSGLHRRNGRGRDQGGCLSLYRGRASLTDSSIAEFNPQAAALLWEPATAFLAPL